ncbi:MAG: sugar ABC transporter substrate-binding protein [Ktedonobacteraceae bacterium]|nr:sugar ABC transporter substrate-binding protein [Ktedonobacteraceae bacterium]
MQRSILHEHQLNIIGRHKVNRSHLHLRPQRGFSGFVNLFTLGMILVIVLAACGGSGGAQGGKVHLTYALWDPNEQVGYQKSINAFEQLHPNISVSITQVPWAQYWQKLYTEFAAGDAPDVFWDHMAYFPQYVQQDQLMNLSPLIQKDKLDLSIYYPQLLQQFAYQGNYYGLPKDWDTITLFYNKNIFKKMGLSAPDNLNWNPTDGGSFLKLAQQLTIDKNGRHPDQPGFNENAISQYGFVSLNDPQEVYWNYIAMNGGKFLDRPFGQNFVFNQPPSVQALQFLVNMILKWHVSPSATETNNNGAAMIQMFAQGQSAMMQTGSWNVLYITQQVNFPFGIVQLPAGPDGRASVFNGLSDAIYAKTAHPQEAWELFKWLASPQSQQILGSGGYVWPAIKSLDSTYVNYWSKKGVDVTAFLKEAQGQTTSFPSTPGYNEASININDAFNEMFLGHTSIQQATNDAVQQANNAILSATGGG